MSDDAPTEPPATSSTVRPFTRTRKVRHQSDRLTISPGPGKREGVLDDKGARALVLGALAAGATHRIAVSIASSAGYDVTMDALKEKLRTDARFAEQAEHAKERADALVEMSLFKAATQEGDVPAMLAWLKNRKPERWRDRSVIEIGIRDVPAVIRQAAERARARLASGAVDAVLVETGPAAPTETPGAFHPDASGGNGHGGNGNGRG